MKKRIMSLILTVVLICTFIPMQVLAAEELPIEKGISKPEKIAYFLEKASGHMRIAAYYIMPEELLKIISLDYDDFKDIYGYDEYKIFQQTDWSLDSTSNWHYTGDWDSSTSPAVTCTRSTNKIVNKGEIFWLTYDNHCSALGGYVYKDSGNGNQFDFANHKLYLRTRFIVELRDFDKGFDGKEYKYYTSGWSEVALINDVYNGKSIYQTYDFSKLDAPVVSREQVKNDDKGKPYLSFYLEFPESIKKAALALKVQGEGAEMNFDVQRRVNGGEWTNSRITNNEFPYDYGERKIFIDDDILANKSSLEYRFRLSYTGSKAANFQTPWSETLKYNVPSWSDSSAWAEEWLKKAEDYDLIPDVLIGADMTQPINRHEFAALSVKLYEGMSGKKAVAGSNPFTDTSDPEILKAVNIGITNGTSADKFSPDALITREQAAVMLTRAYKATYWEGWTLAKDSSYTAKTLDYSGIAVFADDASISAYAKPSVYFMAKNNIINGVGNNMFAPNRANIPANAALTYGQATREAAIKIAVASFENLK